MTKEEMLMQAIGMLPEEMAVQEVTEELKKEAGKLERKEFFYKSRFILAAVAACIVLVITVASINKNPNTNITSKVNDTSINSGSKVYSDENKAGSNKDSINCFVMADTNFKKALQGRTVKLQVVKDMQSDSSSQKKAEQECIVFSFDKDCYINIPGYILDRESGKKYYIKGKEELCKAGNNIYFDVSGEKVKDAYKENIKSWDKKGIKIIAYTDIYQKKDGNMEKTGVFYIGVKQKKKNNKERKIYYGRFENEN